MKDPELSIAEVRAAVGPGRPQQNGAHERMHKTLKAETARPPEVEDEPRRRAGIQTDELTSVEVTEARSTRRMPLRPSPTAVASSSNGPRLPGEQ